MYVIPLNPYLNNVFNNIIFVTSNTCNMDQINDQNLDTQNKYTKFIATKEVATFYLTKSATSI
jgi:hypothetical protein